MEDEAVINIRETSRSLLKLNRRFHRDEETDNCRDLEDISIKPESIISIALKLKTKSPPSLAELLTLKNGLMQHPDSIHEVLKTHGALRGLVRELTVVLRAIHELIPGNDTNKQLAAAACCCNLALGERRAAYNVAKSAGPYLINALHTLTNELALSSCWCVGNISGAGPREASLLVAQGALPGLHAFLLRDETCDAAVYALTHIAYQMKDDFGIDNLTKTLECLYSMMNLSSSALKLLFILSCHKDFDLHFEFIQKLLENLQKSIENHTKCVKKKYCCDLVYLIRILANINLNGDNYALILNCLMNISDSIKLLLYSDTDNLKVTLLWFLGNLYKCNREEMFFYNLRH